MKLSAPLLKYVESRLPPNHGGHLVVIANPSYYTVYWQPNVMSPQILVCSILVRDLMSRRYKIDAQIMSFVTENLLRGTSILDSLDISIEAFKTK